MTFVVFFLYRVSFGHHLSVIKPSRSLSLLPLYPFAIIVVSLNVGEVSHRLREFIMILSPTEHGEILHLVRSRARYKLYCVLIYRFYFLPFLVSLPFPSYTYDHPVRELSHVIYRISYLDKGLRTLWHHRTRPNESCRAVFVLINILRWYFPLIRAYVYHKPQEEIHIF